MLNNLFFSNYIICAILHALFCYLFSKEVFNKKIGAVSAIFMFLLSLTASKYVGGDVLSFSVLCVVLLFSVISFIKGSHTKISVFALAFAIFYLTGFVFNIQTDYLPAQGLGNVVRGFFMILFSYFFFILFYLYFTKENLQKIGLNVVICIFVLLTALFVSVLFPLLIDNIVTDYFPTFASIMSVSVPFVIVYLILIGVEKSKKHLVKFIMRVGHKKMTLVIGNKQKSVLLLLILAIVVASMVFFITRASVFGQIDRIYNANLPLWIYFIILPFVFIGAGIILKKSTPYNLLYVMWLFFSLYVVLIYNKLPFLILPPLSILFSLLLFTLIIFLKNRKKSTKN